MALLRGWVLLKRPAPRSAAPPPSPVSSCRDAETNPPCHQNKPRTQSAPELVGASMTPFRFEEGLARLFAFERGNNLLTLLALAERARLSQRIADWLTRKADGQRPKKIRVRLVGATMDQKHCSVLGGSSRGERARHRAQRPRAHQPRSSRHRSRIRTAWSHRATGAA